MADINIKFPTMDEFAKEVAEKALDEFLYDGKSIREWIQIITSEDVISRQYLIEKATNWEKHFHDSERYVSLTDIQNAPPVIPQESVLDQIRAEIKQAADKQFQIAMGVSDLNERYAHIQMENAYRHSLNIIDKYRGEQCQP